MRVTRTEWHDWFVDRGTSAVFVGDKVTVLSELATTLVTIVGDGIDLAELAVGLAATYGDPEDDVGNATRLRVLELASSGILSVDANGFGEGDFG